MVDVTGPISSLPGSKHDVPEGMKCDDCGAPAAIRIQGETDSFGCEMHDLCVACHNKMKNESEEAVPHTCDWCKETVIKTFPKRDYEEGLYGPVYYVCKSCSDAYNKQLLEELSSFEDYSYDDY